MCECHVEPDRPARRPCAVLLAMAGAILLAVYGMFAVDGNVAAAGNARDLSRGAMVTFVFSPRPQPVAPLSFKDGADRERTMADWRGKVVLLNLWASWCAPCLREMPALDRLNQGFDDKDFEVVAVSIDRKGKEVAARFLKKTGATSLKLHIDQSGKILRDLNAQGLPTTVLVSREGKMLGRLAGPAEWDSDEARAIVRAAIDGALDKPAPAGKAAMPDNARAVETALLTSPEIAARLKAGATTIIIPTGGTEQNGAHMVTGKHNFVVAETARRIARALGDTLVAPVLAHVPEGDVASRAGHMAYPGTISLSEATFAKVLEETAASFKAHGFKTIVLLGDSGGNQNAQAALAEKLSADWAGDGVRVIQASDYYGDNGQVDWLKGEGESDQTIGAHAGIRDTSELMAVLPDGIRKDALGPASAGASGDATRASAERGRKMIELKVKAAVAEIRRKRAMPLPAPQSSLWSKLLFWRN